MHKLGISKSGRQVKKADIVCNSSDLKVVVKKEEILASFGNMELPLG